MYKIIYKEFKTKKELKDYCYEIYNNNLNTQLSGDILEFTIELLKYHYQSFTEHKFEFPDNSIIIPKYRPNQNVIIDLVVETSIYTPIKKIFKKVKSTKYSIKNCVNNIPPYNPVTIEYVFKYGKYKGMNIRDINDDNYLWWLANESNFLDTKDKIYINQYLKYGFIPYNDYGFQTKYEKP